MDAIASVRSTGPFEAAGTPDASSLLAEDGEKLQSNIVTEQREMPRKAHVLLSSGMFNQKR